MAKPFTSVYEPAPAPAPAVAPAPVKETLRPADSQAAVLSEALGTSMQPYGVDFAKLKTKKAIDVVPSLLSAGQNLAVAQADENRAKMEGQALIAKEQASALENHAQTIRSDVAAQEKKLAEFPYPEFHPTKENAQSLGELFSIVSTMGVLLGGAGKLSSINALNAMGGMLKGWQAGRADLFKREKETFDKEFQRIKAIHEDLKRTFDEYMKARVVDKEAAMYKAQELATKAGADSIIAAQIKVGNYKAVADSLQAYANLAQHKEDMDARAREAAVRREFEAAEKEKDRKQAEKLASDKFFRELGSAGIRKAIYDATGKVIDQKGAAAVQSTSTALREVTDLRDRLKDPEIRTGLQSLPAPFITKLKSLVGREEAEIGDFINTELTGNDKTTLFIKDAILASFKVEQGLTGTRVPVFTQKVVGPILDPRSYTPEVYDKLLSTRQNQLFGTAADYGFSQEDMAKIARLPSEPVSATPAPSAAPAAAPKTATKADISATAKANGITEEEVKKRLREKGFKIEGE